MMRLKLQLFAQKLNTKESIVDLLKSQGKDSSYSARKELAKSLGISNYSGSEDQNVALINALSGGSASNGQNNKPPSGGGNAGGNTGGGNTGGGNTGGGSLKGVDNKTLDVINSSYQPSDKVTNADKEAEEARQKVLDMANVDSIVDQSTMDIINTPFAQSTAITEAFNYTNTLLEKLSSGRTSYTDQIKALMDDIQNRDKFEYDVDSDTLFQQALSSAMSSGKTAMQDTIGQASALTGGYGSTYATTAGNQTYNAFIQDAYNNLPEYYQMALEAYQMEGQEMYNQLGMLADADATEYQRMYDSWSANFSNAQQMYQNEYNEWQGGVTNAINSAGLQIDEYSQIFDQTYTAYTATANNAQTLRQNEYTKWADEVNNALNVAKIANSDYWSGAELSQRKSEFSQEMAYKNSALAQDNAQFIAKYDINGDGVVNAKDQVTTGSGTGSGLKEPSETQMSKGLEAFNTGGMDALNQYINSLPSTVDKELVAEYVGSYGSYDTADNPLPVEKRTFTKVKDTFNYFGGVDNNDVVQDQYGNKFRIDELPEGIRKEISKLGIGKTYTAK